MDVPEPQPLGPLSNETFHYGIVLSIIGFVMVIGVLAMLNIITYLQAIGTLLIGGPLFVLGSSIVLAKWLGYDKNARYKSAKYAIENNNLSEDDD